MALARSRGSSSSKGSSRVVEVQCSRSSRKAPRRRLQGSEQQQLLLLHSACCEIPTFGYLLPPSEKAVALDGSSCPANFKSANDCYIKPSDVANI
jgi:hypothetical protein